VENKQGNKADTHTQWHTAHLCVSQPHAYTQAHTAYRESHLSATLLATQVVSTCAIPRTSASRAAFELNLEGPNTNTLALTLTLTLTLAPAHRIKIDGTKRTANGKQRQIQQFPYLGLGWP